MSKEHAHTQGTAGSGHAPAPAPAPAAAAASSGAKPVSKLVYPHKEYPEAGQAKEVAEGIYWVATPLPFRLRSINAYLIEEKEGWTIVDCGYGKEEVRKQWESVWQTQMKDKPVTRVIVTHFHPDHVGNAGWFQQKWGVRPHMSETEWAFANLGARGLNTDDIERRAVFYESQGLSRALIDQFLREVFRYPLGCPSVPDSYTRLKDADLMTINGHEWKVMVGRGHSPEHVCLYSEGLGIMLAGDQILPEISPNVSVWHVEPDANALDDFLATMKRFRPVLGKDTLVLPSHRRPFRGVHDRFDELEQHHALRLGQVLNAAGPAGITAADVMPIIFPANLDGHQIGFAVHEALAHLNYLMYQGKMTRKSDAQGVVRFYRA